MTIKRTVSNTFITGFLGIISAILLCFAAYWSIRFAVADHFSRTGSLDHIHLSTRLAPRNARYLLRLAELEASEGLDASPALQQAVAASPLNSTVWIQLGLQAEQMGDMAAAGKALLRAAQFDLRFRPRWELASFYVRRNDPEQSRHWAREALRIGGPAEFPAVFRLCWNVGARAEDIWREAIPKTPVVLEQYLGFLLAENKLDDAAPVAAQFVDIAEPSQVQSLLAYCDAAIVAKRAGEALYCWNGMSRRGLLPYPAIDPSTGKSLVNGKFQRPPIGLGFDWRLANIGGVSVNYDETNPHLRIVFSGKQPESCETLVAWVALEPLRKFRLACRYETAGIPPGSGLKWQLYNAANASQIIPDAPSLSQENQTTATMEFRTPEGVSKDFQLWRLALAYQRAPGTIRIEGSLRLTGVSLEFAP